MRTIDRGRLAVRQAKPSDLGVISKKGLILERIPHETTTKMGNSFGMMPNNGVNLYFHPDVTPDPLKSSKHDPLLGFDGRKERSVKTTPQEMYSAKIAVKDRDYCVDQLMVFRQCRVDNWPFPVNCEHEKHAYLNCQYEDYVNRMKDFERERRLMVRAKSQAAEIVA